VPGQRIARLGAFLDEDLHESAHFGRVFPGRGALARGQPDDDVADAARLARFEDDVLRQVVALVEEADRGHPVFHRGAIFAFDRARAHGRAGDGLGQAGGLGIGIFGRFTAAAGQRGKQE